MKTTKKPLWATSARQTALVKLFLDSRGGFCVHGHKCCTIESHNYFQFTEDLIADWVELDRWNRAIDRDREQRELHSLGERYYRPGRWNSIAKDIFYDRQPSFVIEGIGFSALTCAPFAKVRIANSYITLFVDLSSATKSLGKNAKRKALRYGKASQTVYSACAEAVRDYLK